MTDVIRAQAVIVRDAREQLAKCKETVAEFHRQYMENTAGHQEALANAKANLRSAEGALKVMALTNYILTQDKHPGSGVEIGDSTKLTYTPEAALAWALAKRLALALDVDTFEAIAKANPIKCVVITREPRVTLARDMRRALG